MDIPPELKKLARLPKLLSAKESENINCHKAVLYLVGLISYEELIADPRQQQDTNFTFRERALRISNAKFAPVTNPEELLNLAENGCESGNLYVGQILDNETNELAHSYIVFKNNEGVCIGFDKAGFKEAFSVYELSQLLAFKNYQNQGWRFVSIGDTT
jgi:hypothetical protein